MSEGREPGQETEGSRGEPGKGEMPRDEIKKDRTSPRLRLACSSSSQCL